MSFNLPGVKQDSDIESLFKSVGFIVVQWGHCEQSLSLEAKYGHNYCPKVNYTQLLLQLT